MKRRELIAGATASLGALVSTSSFAQTSGRYATGAEPIHYPDPDIISLDPRFKAKLGNAAIQRLYTGTSWAEGPAWNGVGRYLVWSDIPANEQLRYTDEDESVSRHFRSPSRYSNGNTFDFQGRQVSCEHLERRVVRYEFDGSVTVLADRFGGKSLNAPNDVVVHPDGGIWFTDPGYGSLGLYEGTQANTGSPQPFQKEAVYRIDPASGKVEKATDDVFKPNGLCFSPDYKKLYVADSGVSHYSKAKPVINVWDVDGTQLKNGRVFTSMTYEGKSGIADGIRCDAQGNIWSSAGWAGKGYDGVHIFAEDGDRIGMIVLPEICSNLCFGGRKRNRLFMTASQSLYAVYVGTTGAHIC
jgi:gluconolactonase